MPEFSFYFSYTRTNFRHIFLACLVKDVQTGCSLQIMTIMRKLYLLTLGRTKIVVPSEIVLNILIKKRKTWIYKVDAHLASCLTMKASKMLWDLSGEDHKQKFLLKEQKIQQGVCKPRIILHRRNGSWSESWINAEINLYVRGECKEERLKKFCKEFLLIL